MKNDPYEYFGTKNGFFSSNNFSRQSNFRQNKFVRRERIIRNSKRVTEPLPGDSPGKLSENVLFSVRIASNIKPLLYVIII